MIEFLAWPKTIRLENRRPPVFTEKIDGTNAAIIIDDWGAFGCQSRRQLITPENDNHGFAKWAYDNKEELMKLGPGHHFGEWWGLGIQRGYNMKEKVFSLFNVRRWGPHNPNTPACVSVVPIIEATDASHAVEILTEYGSFAAPGYIKPEGVVMYEPDTDTCFKIIMDK